MSAIALPNLEMDVACSVRIQTAMLEADLLLPKTSEVGINAAVDAMLAFARVLSAPYKERGNGALDAL